MRTSTPVQLLSDKRVAELCEISRRKVWDLHARALIPEPTRLNRSVRWRSDDIEQWIRTGCPSREAFEARKRTLPPAEDSDAAVSSEGRP